MRMNMESNNISQSRRKKFFSREKAAVAFHVCFVITPFNVGSVLWRLFSTVGDSISTCGDSISTCGDSISTCGIASVLWRLFSTVGE